MKVIITIGLMAYSLAVAAQTKIEKTFQVPQGKKLEFYFDFPELIKVHTWDKQDVLVKGSVSINRGENDSAFELSSKVSGPTFTISSEIKDRDNIPRRTVIRIGDEEYYFKTDNPNDPEIRKFVDEKGSYSYMTNGIDMDITLEIFIPKGMESKIESKFGMVEITNFNAPLMVNAPHGGVDATIVTSNTGSIIARTKFGEILTNLETKFNSAGWDGDSHDHWTEVKASFGNGHKYDLESKFGKVYLRKP
jgi:hypothetical protein